MIKDRQESENDGFDEARLRQYEKDRLTYFYAVVECDSKETADEIFKECDGNQFENSTIEFDLRFVPDGTKFEAANLKEECK